MKTLKIEDLSKDFGSTEVLKKINLATMFLQPIRFLITIIQKNLAQKIEQLKLLTIIKLMELN